MTKEKVRHLSLFAGIGSPEESIKELEEYIIYELVGFSEIDKHAINSYCNVHNVSKDLNLGDITQINIESLPKDIDLITHGSPCQSFSAAGKGHGGDEGSGTRSSLMWNTVAICKHCKPKYVVWENVKNVLSKKHVHNFEKYLNKMEELGYRNYYKVLNAKDFGIPQNRERIFVVSIRKDIKKDFKFPEGFYSEIRLKDILEDEVDSKFYVSEEKVQQLFKNCKGKIDLNKQVVGTCHKDNNLSYATRNRVYSEEKNSPTLSATMYKDAPIVIRANTSKNMPIRIGGLFDTEEGKHQAGSVWDKEGLAPTLDTMQGGWRQPCIIIDDTQGFDGTRIYKDIVPTLRSQRSGLKIVTDYKVRRLTPRECWRLMGFKDEHFDKAQEVCSNTQLYKQAGNSIVVPVMKAILKNLLL